MADSESDKNGWTDSEDEEEQEAKRQAQEEFEIR